MYLITEEEKALTKECLDKVLKYGAQAAKVAVNKNNMDLCMLLNGELDKVTHSADSAMMFIIFADGRYGTFSTNRMDHDSLDGFIKESIAMTRLLAPDPLRKLPDPSRLVRNAATGLEMELADPARKDITPERRIELAREASCWRGADADGYKIISEETEYSDSQGDIFIVDSQGLECRNVETSYDIGSEVTIQAPDGSKISSYAWDAMPWLSDVTIKGCAAKALEKAARQIGPRRLKSGKYQVVIDREVASKMVSPILSALSAPRLQQHNSFLMDSLGQKLFPVGLTIIDRPQAPRCPGARLFDGECVAMYERPIIEDGVVKEYFVSTYMAGKTGFAPTNDAPARPVISPFLKGDAAPTSMDAEEIMRKIGDGILITGFNGGNSNSATGDFSYGIEGFAFRGGKVAFPVHELVMTGNFLTLWNGFLAAGTDARRCMTKVVPTLAFEGVDISA